MLSILLESKTVA